MILVDTALERCERENRPVRVAIVGAGYIGRGIAYQILMSARGLRVTAVCARNVPATGAWLGEQGAAWCRVDSAATILASARRGAVAVTDDADLVCSSDAVDVVVEATGTIEFAAGVALAAIRNGKHLVLMNAELDATVGPLLRTYAAQAGVVYTNSDGDQPGVIMNLYRFVRSLGFQPVLAGNVKGLHDPYRTPATQAQYARTYQQKPRMVTSFADGSKVSLEMAVVANATGLGVAQRGMLGPRCEHVNDAPSVFPLERLLAGGIVDYVIGAQPGPGVFVLGYNDQPVQQQYMKYYKMGDGPLYVFYTPYHLCHAEAPLTAARAALFQDAAVAPLGAPVCDVITLAKRDLAAGETLDAIGGFTCYGVIEHADVARAHRLLPLGLAEDCRLKRSVSRDTPISVDDVERPADRLADRLRAEQDARFQPLAGLAGATRAHLTTS